jgi:DNA ligase-1
MLDGELYIHGTPLPVISGICRKEQWVEDSHGKLEFWIFDYGNDTDDAETRASFLNSLPSDFDPEYKIKINAQVKLSSYAGIKALHDIYVQEGFEGAICRNASNLYGWGGKKDNRMVKLKEFQDDEFPILGISKGLRDEDMVFRCSTIDHKEFEAKPVGPRELKWQYLKDEDKLIGKMLTVKFFNYTPDGVPFLPVGKAIRDYE